MDAKQWPEAEQAMRALIGARYPGHGIAGEEFAAVHPQAPWRWVLDPIDGTRSFIAGVPLWGTLIALWHEGRPVLGCVDHPALGERYLAVAGSATLHARDGTQVLRTRRCASLAQAVAFATDSKLLATGGGAPTEDGEVKIFEVGSWKQVTDIKGGHSDTVYGVAFSPDGKKLASCGADKFIKVFEVPSGKFLKSFEGHTHHVLDVGWKSDGKLLASAGADSTIKIWDYEKGEQVRTINNAHTKQVTRLVFVGKTSTFLTCSGDMQVRAWNVDNGGNTGNYGGNTDFVYAVSASPDGQLIATGGQDGIVRLYRGPGQPKLTLLPPGEATQAKKK